MTAVDLLGYAASIVIITSLLMKSILRLRIIGLVGGMLFFIYGLLLHSVPVAGLNLVNMCINLYFIRQMLTARSYFKLLEVDRNSSYLTSFLEFYQSDIAKFFPHFVYRPDRADMVYLILRDLQPVGLFVMERDASGRALVKLDYVIPGYRDLKAGQFLYHELEHLLPAKQVTTLYSVAGDDVHQRYLKRMGFTVQGGEGQKKLYARELG
ncbi:MAG: hypothetical protein GC179_22480 [Anaerolineaceae bacterium]|nr:hypothetical protein [Anaerolineaceae bacterium]